MIPDNQLARGIQSRSVCGLVAESRPDTFLFTFFSPSFSSWNKNSLRWNLYPGEIYMLVQKCSNTFLFNFFSNFFLRIIWNAYKKKSLKSEQHFLFASILMTFFCLTKPMGLRPTQNRNNVLIFFILFFIFLKSSETYANPSLNEIGAKLFFFYRKIDL